jgi:hypothetical protein
MHRASHRSLDRDAVFLIRAFQSFIKNRWPHDSSNLAEVLDSLSTIKHVYSPRGSVRVTRRSRRGKWYSSVRSRLFFSRRSPAALLLFSTCSSAASRPMARRIDLPCKFEYRSKQRPAPSGGSLDSRYAKFQARRSFELEEIRTSCLGVMTRRRSGIVSYCEIKNVKNYLPPRATIIGQAAQSERTALE